MRNLLTQRDGGAFISPLQSRIINVLDAKACRNVSDSAQHVK